jgi:integrase-like protein
VGWRNAKHRYQWRATLATFVFPLLGDLPVSAIDTNLVVQVLEQLVAVAAERATNGFAPFWQARPETASRVRGRIEAVLDAATVRGFRQGPNPAQWRGNLAHILPARSKVQTVEHYAALQRLTDNLAALLARARAHDPAAVVALADLIEQQFAPGRRRGGDPYAVARVVAPCRRSVTHARTRGAGRELRPPRAACPSRRRAEQLVHRNTERCGASRWWFLAGSDRRRNRAASARMESCEADGAMGSRMQRRSTLQTKTRHR